MAREVVEEKGRGGTMNAEESHDATIMYLVMPSYAEPYKREIKQILLIEKNNQFFLKTSISTLLSQTAKISNI